MKQRKLVIGLLVMLAVAVSGFTFAFWAGSLTGDDIVSESNTVVVGTGEAVTTEVTFTGTGGTGSLVPAGRVDDSVEGDATESVVFSFDVFWDEAAGVNNDSYDGTAWDLDVTISNVSIDGNALTLTAGEAGLINFAIGGAVSIELADVDAAVVTITLTLDEPLNQSEYDDYAGLNIVFDVTFEVNEPA